jgi:alpha-L-rhamnosidase
VIKYLVKYVLGVESQAPGFARFRVAPRPPAGVTVCQGAVPTPHGFIRVGWDWGRPRKPAVSVEQPRGVRRVP